MKQPIPKLCLLSVLLWITSPGLIHAQDEPDFNDGYLTPPDEIAEQILAPRHENVTLSNLAPSGEYFINRVGTGLSPLSAYAKPHYNLGGLQVDHIANRSRSWTLQTPSDGLEFIDPETGDVRTADVPDVDHITHMRWSPDGSRIAWLGHQKRATHLYVTDVASGSTEQVNGTPVLATLTSSVEWSGDGNYLFTVVIPENRDRKPVRSRTPNTLQVQKTTEGENRLRTFPSLLKDQHEKAMLEYYITGQLVRIDSNSGEADPIGEPALIRNISAAPSGEHLLVQTLQKPFSNVVPVSWFGWTEEIWDLDGNVLAEVRTSEKRAGVPDHDIMEDYGRSQVQWRPDGNGLSVLMEPDEKEENGDEEENENGEENDQHRIVQWLPPFGDDDKEVIYESSRDIRSVEYSDDAAVLFITQRRSGTEELFAYFTDQPDTTYTIYEHDTSEFYENPGSLMTRPGSLGVSAVRMSSDGNHVFLSGTQYHENFEEQAPQPFIDRVHIESGETERLFESSEEMYEAVTAVLDDDVSRIVLNRENAETHPDSWLYDVQSGNLTKLTDNTDFNEAVTRAQRDRFKVKRADGFEFWVDVVMPSDWDGEPLPGLLWHYPREFDDQEDYDEGLRRYNINRFPRVGTRTADIMIEAGYAVIRPDWPIAGDRGTSNDGFVWSIVQNSTAVIDSVEARGYVDRHRMAMGGHSYGAFGTVNAMIHTSFFKAGIAGAGNFNRTLTPMGFQRERSDLWRGLDRYLQMSPIFWADRMDGALLMYHGEIDQNVGTWPTNSKRLFHALNGLDKEAVLYMYPHEGHGPAAEETLLDMWTRWVEWLDYHVK